MKKKAILIEIEIETEANETLIEKAIEKGIYYGLDIKGISMPKDVKIKSVMCYNI